MKNFKLPFLALALVLLVSSCKKEDVQLPNTSKVPTVTTAAKASGWTSLNSWSSSKNDSLTTHFSSISDTSISADVVKSGLVLIYKKNGSQIQSLPFQDASTNTYWYYQVSKGSLRINGDNNAEQSFNNQNFFYFILTSQQVSNFQAAGKTKFDLMQLSYEQAIALFK